MEAVVTRRFKKEEEKELDKNTSTRTCRQYLTNTKNRKVEWHSKLKELKGYTTAYRIKMGDFRIGFF